MLLEFRVQNYRSIRDEQVLSLVASSGDNELESHLSDVGIKGVGSCVRSAVIYGPNASGKSTLLLALNYMRAVIAESAAAVQPGQTYNVQPFRLDENFLHKPTAFEMTFILNGIRHQYSFAMTAERIVSESLLLYKTRRPTEYFSRKINSDGETYTYEFSSYLTGPKKIWQESTRPNALFLSTCAQLNSEILGPIFRWIVENILYLPPGAGFIGDLTNQMLSTDAGRDEIRDFLSSADIGISSVEAVQRKSIQTQFVIKEGGVAQANPVESEVLVPIFQHATLKGTAKFELADESQGTQRLYWLIAPFLDVLKNGRVLIVDELDASLHTLLVRRLISMFNDPNINKANAQLVFSTHDISLLDNSLFRRDQIWFVEKDRDQATCLFPFTDFSPRKLEAWARGYLTGRYGAVPFFPEDAEITREILG
jgi:AAA15 family ATPase/GTPase